MDQSAARGWAAALVAEFGSLGGALARSREAVTRVAGHEAAEALNAVSAAIETTLRSQAAQRPFVGSEHHTIDYLRSMQGFSPVEVMRVLFLDSQNCLLRQEIVAAGTVDEAPIYGREIVKRCLELDAVGIILAHNHPSGDHAASKADVALTRQVAAQCRSFDIRLFDHIIVSPRGFTSFRAEGFL